jgi:hypothetical protein
VAIRLEGTHSVQGKLHELSATGGLLGLSKAFERGDFAEVVFQTSKGTVHGMAELLVGPTRINLGLSATLSFRCT